MSQLYGPETDKSMERRVREGFLSRYCSGRGIDVGFRGIPNASPLPGATGVDTDFPGYDGRHLPFDDGSFDFVYSSHCLEHIADYSNALNDYMRVLRIGGYLVLSVPHQFLYEKRAYSPSVFNDDHKRFYTPSRLLAEIESTLPPNAYRIRLLRDCDDGYDYSIPPHRHAVGEYQIECVIQKIQLPQWRLL